MLSAVNEFLLKCFFIGGILLFFGLVWWAWTDHFARIANEELRRMDRNVLSCEDADPEEDVVSGHPASTFLRNRNKN